MQTSHLAIFAALSGLLVAGPASAQSCDLDVLQPVPPMTQRPEVVDFSADGSVALLQAPIDIFSGNYTHTFLWTKGEAIA